MHIFLLLCTISHTYTILLLYSLMRVQRDNETVKILPLFFCLQMTKWGDHPYPHSQPANTEPS
jgi:hypothetical protein